MCSRPSSVLKQRKLVKPTLSSASGSANRVTLSSKMFVLQGYLRSVSLRLTRKVVQATAVQDSTLADLSSISKDGTLKDAKALQDLKRRTLINSR